VKSVVKCLCVFYVIYVKYNMELKNMLLVVYIDIQINTVLQIFVNTWIVFWEKYQNQRPHVSLLVT